MRQVKNNQVVEEPMSSTTDRKDKTDQAGQDATRSVGKTQPNQQNQNSSPDEAVNEQQQKQSKPGHTHGQGCGCG